jgi:hypothetical protein
MASPVQYRIRSLSHAAGHSQTAVLQHGQELDDDFSGLDAGTGLMTVAGFGSLLSGELAVLPCCAIGMSVLRWLLLAQKALLSALHPAGTGIT